MAHFSHGLRIYRRRWHILYLFGILILPMVFIVIAGQVSHLSAIVLTTALIESLYRLAIAYGISLLCALVLAIFLGTGRAGNFFIPVFDLLQNLPSFALIPVFVLLFGYSDLMAIIFAATSIVWPILFSLVSALRMARMDLNEAATIFGARGWSRIAHYLLPLSFPALLTGSMVGISIGWEAIIGMEIIGNYRGIGTFLNNASASNQTVLLLGIIALLLLVFSINKLIWTPLLQKTYLYGE